MLFSRDHSYNALITGRPVSEPVLRGTCVHERARNTLNRMSGSTIDKKNIDTRTCGGLLPELRIDATGRNKQFKATGPVRKYGAVGFCSQQFMLVLFYSALIFSPKLSIIPDFQRTTSRAKQISRHTA